MTRRRQDRRRPGAAAAADGPDWPAYLSAFHARRAGITEDVLGHALDTHGLTAYDWAAEALPLGGSVLDLACGSGPLFERLQPRAYVGLDLSAAELAVAAQRGVPVARADAARLPLADASLDAVVASMALMLLPLPATLTEVRRVLRPGGVIVATVPAAGPLPPADWLRYARLYLALRRPGLVYPNDEAMAAPAAAFNAAGLRLLSDEARGFSLEVRTERIAEQLLASLYLPDVGPRPMAASRRVVRRWVGSRITTPVRRLVAALPLLAVSDNAGTRPR